MSRRHVWDGSRWWHRLFHNRVGIYLIGCLAVDASRHLEELQRKQRVIMSALADLQAVAAALKSQVATNNDLLAKLVAKGADAVPAADVAAVVADVQASVDALASADNAVPAA